MAISKSVDKHILALALALVAVVGFARGQVDPCYCIQTVSWDFVNERWEADTCQGPCAPGEGACTGDFDFVAGTLYIWCECTGGVTPLCNCLGKIRNPNYDGTMLAPLIECSTNIPCLPPQGCSPNHLLATWGWGSQLAICKCN